MCHLGSTKKQRWGEHWHAALAQSVVRVLVPAGAARDALLAALGADVAVARATPHSVDLARSDALLDALCEEEIA